MHHMTHVHTWSVFPRRAWESINMWNCSFKKGQRFSFYIWNSIAGEERVLIFPHPVYFWLKYSGPIYSRWSNSQFSTHPFLSDLNNQYHINSPPPHISSILVIFLPKYPLSGKPPIGPLLFRNSFSLFHIQLQGTP